MTDSQPRAVGAKYGHTNVIARDWRRLAAFYAEVVTTHTADGRRVTWCYLTDPEGNLIELQSWAPPP